MKRIEIIPNYSNENFEEFEDKINNSLERELVELGEDLISQKIKFIKIKNQSFCVIIRKYKEI